MQANASRPSHPALREGLVFGVISGIIAIPVNLLQNLHISDLLGNILGVLFLMVLIALNWLSGVRASQWTGRVGTGALAGVLMELVGFLFGAILTLTRIFVVATPLHQMLSHATAGPVLQFITLSGIGFVGYLLLGALIGAMGGLIGRGRAQLPPHV